MLKASLQVAAVFALIALGVSTAVLAHDAHRILLDADRTLSDIDGAVKVQNMNIAAEERQLDLVLSHVDSTVGTLKLAADAQSAYWNKTSADSDKTVKALRLAVDRASLLLDHTDQSLNGSVLPDVDRQINLTAENAQAALVSVEHAGDALTFSIGDLPPIFANLQEGTAQLSLAAGHANNILLSGDKTAAYYEKKLTTPASFARQTANVLLDVGSKLGNIMAGFVK